MFEKQYGPRPFPGVRGGQLETIVPAVLPVLPLLDRGERWDVRVDPANAVRVVAHRSPRRPAAGTVVLVHGLAGSARSRYVIQTAREALRAGWSVVRMNLRNCGGTERLSSSFCNAAQDGDVAAVLARADRERWPRPHVAVGFSLGGNIVLRLACGRPCAADGVAAVNPSLDLGACSRALALPSNRVYQEYFVWLLCSQIRRIRRVRKVPGPTASPLSFRTVRDIEDRFTAPDGGWSGAEAYYAAASAGPLLGELSVPTFVLSAENDPFVPAENLRHWCRSANARLRLAIVRRGGHVGYLQPGRPRFWAARAVVAWLEELRASGPSPRCTPR